MKIIFYKSLMLSYLLFFVIIFSCHAQNLQDKSRKLPYQDASLLIEQRVDDLLSRMTLEEKSGQLNMPVVDKMDGDSKFKVERCRQFTEGTLIKGIGPGGGLFGLANSILHNGPRQQVDFFNELQKIAVEVTRLGIPLLQIEEGTHGVMCSGATIFPEGLGLGSTWDMDLIKEVYAVAAREARSVGIHQLYTLCIEPNRDPRLGRNEECYTEDPYLSSRIAEKIVEGAQGNDITSANKVVAGLCHFPGQSEPLSGLEKGEMEISERKLREIFLPPWEAGIKKAGALGVMATYPAIDGEPVHASDWLLTDILRGELGFEGIVLSEGTGFKKLLWDRIVATEKEAGVLALKAGVDVSITREEAYMLPLIESVREGLVSEELIDRAVRRILKTKFMLGLFENPYVDLDRAETVVYSKKHQKLALEAAREGIVLLKNEGNLLPLKKDIGRIAVIGPNVDNGRNQLGDYTSHVILQDLVTVLDGIKGKVSASTKVEYVKGCNVLRTNFNEIDKACKAAKRADVAIVVVGENEWQARDENGEAIGTNGEHKDVANLDLTGLQEELIQAVHSTGTPVIVVLINGRPLSTRWTAEHVPAIVEAWLPGEKGGEAVADILFGDINPSGKLAITIPRHSGQLPAYYSYKPSKDDRMHDEQGWVDMLKTPLYEFGFGLSYTTFEYSNLAINPPEAVIVDDIQVSVDVENTGKRTGAEIAQLYINDMLSSMTTPVIELKGFEKVMLEPGEKKTVHFTLTPYDLSLLNRRMERVVEPGEFSIMVGSSCKDIKLKGILEIID